MDALNSAGKSLKGAKVLVLGVAYKKDIEDIRESPALKLLELLCAKETDVSFNDPYINEVKLTHVALTSTELSSKILSAADCVVIATDHSCYDIKDIAAQAKLVFDTRGVTTEIRSENIHRLGE